jgi:hypothetical protein
MGAMCMTSSLIMPTISRFRGVSLVIYAISAVCSLIRYLPSALGGWDVSINVFSLFYCILTERSAQVYDIPDALNPEVLVNPGVFFNGWSLYSPCLIGVRAPTP